MPKFSLIYLLPERFNLAGSRTRFMREITPLQPLLLNRVPCRGDPVKDSHVDFTSYGGVRRTHDLPFPQNQTADMNSHIQRRERLAVRVGPLT